jgi:hypothetical protein
MQTNPIFSLKIPLLMIASVKLNSFIRSVNGSEKVFSEKQNHQKIAIDVCCSVSINKYCNKLKCSREQLFYCIAAVGKHSKTVELFWSMNQDRLKKQMIHR